MIINAKIKYEEEYLPSKRHRIPRIREVEETIPVELRELKRSDAPVAMVVTDYQSYIDEKGEDQFGLRETSFHAIDGQLYSEKRDMRGALDEGPYSMDLLLKAIERKGDCYYCWNDKSREGVLDSLKEFVASHVLVDGVVYNRRSEPRYVVQTFGLGHNHGSTALFVDYHYNENIGKENYFNALQRDEAIAYANEVATYRGDTDSIGRFDVKNIKVLMPEMVRCNPSLEHGDGCAFLNSLEGLVQASESTLEAGALVMAATGSQLSESDRVSLEEQIGVAKSHVKAERVAQDINKNRDR